MENNLASVFLEDFAEIEKMEKSVNFFRRSPYSYVVWLMVIDHHCKSQKLTIDNIERSVERLASRKTLFSFLDDAVKHGFFTKTKDPDDKRRTLISPTEETLNHFNKWSKTLVSKLNINSMYIFFLPFFSKIENVLTYLH